MQTITQTVCEGITYYGLTYRGSSYTLRCKRGGEWELSIRRLALGRSNPGSCKYFDTLAELEKSYPAFSGIEQMINADTGAAAIKH